MKHGQNTDEEEEEEEEVEEEDHIGDFAGLLFAGLLFACLLFVCLLFDPCFVRVSSVALLPGLAPDRWHARQILVSSCLGGSLPRDESTMVLPFERY